MRPSRQNPDRGNSVANLVTPTTAESFSDGTRLEFVRVKGESRLLVWRNNRPRVVERFEFGNRIYEPMALSPNVLDAVRFPGGNRCPRGRQCSMVSSWSGPRRETNCG